MYMFSTFTRQGPDNITTAHVHELLASALQTPPPPPRRRWWAHRSRDPGTPCSALHEAVQHRQASLDIREASFGPRSVAVATGQAGVAAAWLLVAAHGCADGDAALQRCGAGLPFYMFPRVLHYYDIYTAFQGPHCGSGCSGGGVGGVGGVACQRRPALVDTTVAAVSGHRATSGGAMDHRYDLWFMMAFFTNTCAQAWSMRGPWLFWPRCCSGRGR